MAAFKGVTDKAIANAKAGGHTVEPNLILRVSNTGSRSWLFRYQTNGKIKQIGLGGYPARSLKAARDLAEIMRDDVANGREPMERIKPTPGKTFKHYALAYVAKAESGWKNAKHRQQWRNTLNDYVYDLIGDKLAADIKRDDIHQTLLPLWEAGKIETCSRVRMRIEKILDYAYHDLDIDRRNPARWKGNLELSFGDVSPRTKAEAAGKLKPHVAPPWKDVPAIMAKLRAKPEVTSALLLRWSILTVARSMEARGATWDEISGKVWTVPKHRTKNSKEHFVPLNSEALEILAIQASRKVEGSNLIFPGPKGKVISDVAINKVLHAAYPAITAHGIARSSFRDWVADETSYPDKIAEAALNHNNSNEIEASYLRTKFLEKRIPLMRDWGKYLASYSSIK